MTSDNNLPSMCHECMKLKETWDPVSRRMICPVHPPPSSAAAISRAAGTNINLPFRHYDQPGSVSSGRYPSPNTSTDMDTDSDGPMYTPYSSTCSTPVPSAGKRSRRPTSTQQVCIECQPADCHDKRHKSERKKQNERANRRELQEAVHIQENAILSYVGVNAGNRQSASNATTSGLMFKKCDTFNVSSAIINGILDIMFKHAIVNGTEDKYYATLKEIHLRCQESGDPTTGTLAFNPGQKCRNEHGKKACIVHDHPVWQECRAKQRDENFTRNLRAFRRDVERTKRDEQAQGEEQAKRQRLN